MRWKGRRQSSNVEDRRGGRRRKVAVGGGIGTIVIVGLCLLFGSDLGDALRVAQTVQQPQQTTTTPHKGSAEEEAMAKFVSVVLADTEDVWKELFKKTGKTYQMPKLVLFTDYTQSACGLSSAASGPFYCPGDDKVYIDLGFFKQMQKRLNSPGDFALAYVIAHEVGHHVQNQLGIMDQVMNLRGRVSKKEFNRYMVRLELQADFFAGVWAHHAQKMSNILEEGDIEEAMNAASSVGDDRLQRQNQGYVVPDAFTHGTSEQRVRWFTKGLKTGDISQGDTFSARSL